VDWDQPDCKPWHLDFNDHVSSGDHRGRTIAFDSAHTHRLLGLHEHRIGNPSYRSLGRGHQRERWTGLACAV
jgi:hypothetical protein